LLFSPFKAWVRQTYITYRFREESRNPASFLEASNHSEGETQVQINCARKGFLLGNLVSQFYLPANKAYIMRAHFPSQLQYRLFANFSISNLWYNAVALEERFSVSPLWHCHFLTRLRKRRRSTQVALLDHGHRSLTSRLMHRIEAPIMPFWKRRKIRHGHCGSKGPYICHHRRHISRPIPCLTSSHLAPYSYHAHVITRVRERDLDTLAHTGILKTQLIAQIALPRTLHCHHRTPLGYALLYE
jgi:hypothetical protein